MSGGRFFDTNVVVYTATDGPKRDAALGALASGGTISVQVLDETAAVLLGRKYRYPWSVVGPFLDRHRAYLDVVPLTLAAHDRGRWAAERYRLSVYDGMIVGAALEAGCDTLLTEDMQDGLVINGRLRIVDPFRERM